MNRLAVAYLFTVSGEERAIYWPPYMRPHNYISEFLHARDIRIIRGHRKITAALTTSLPLARAVAKVDVSVRFAEREREALAQHLHAGIGLIGADGFPVYRK